MPRLLKALVPVLALATAALMAGFYVFTHAVRGYVPVDRPAADAVVVLTGGEDRIAAGLTLIEAGRGRRLLISGVNRAIPTKQELARRIGGREATYRCCIDLGYQALDTIGNAGEARAWVDRYGFRSLVVVTSAYHMPRSLAEFSLAMPGVELVPHPVPSRHYRIESWWSHPSTTRLLAVEYVKFLAASARLGIARLADTLDQTAIAERPRPPRPST